MTTYFGADRLPQGRGLGPRRLLLNSPLFQGEVTIHYNKLQADPKQGMSLDIGKLGQSSGTQWPHRPWPLFCIFMTVCQELCGL